jgi:hypothetical protein
MRRQMRDSMSGRSMRAFATFRIDRTETVHPWWRSGLSVWALLSQNPACLGYSLQGYRKRYQIGCKEHRVPKGGICPVCRLDKSGAQNRKWHFSAIYRTVCRRCWNKGKRLTYDGELIRVPPKQYRRRRSDAAYGNVRDSLLTTHQRRLNAKWKYLISLCGDPPVCWHCGLAVQTPAPALTRHVGLTYNRPGQLWIIQEGHAPTCRACWRSGARRFLTQMIISENF